MAADKLLSLYGLKFNPFRSGVPAESLYVTPVVDAFCRRVELTITDGGFALVTGDPGTGKSGVWRVIAHCLAQLPDVTVRTIDRPQSGVPDFYREVGELYGINLRSNNRWGGFKALSLAVGVAGSIITNNSIQLITTGLKVLVLRLSSTRSNEMLAGHQHHLSPPTVLPEWI